MFRYLLLPLFLMALCVALPTLCFLHIEAARIVYDLAQGRTAPFYLEPTTTVFFFFLPKALLVGVCLSGAIVLWDSFKNGVADRSGSGTVSRVIGNLFWCGIYVELANLLNAFAVLVIQTMLRTLTTFSSVDLMSVPVVATFVLGFIGSLWAVCRGVNAPDVLTPRVLASKLRRSTYLYD